AVGAVDVDRAGDVGDDEATVLGGGLDGQVGGDLQAVARPAPLVEERAVGADVQDAVADLGAVGGAAQAVAQLGDQADLAGLGGLLGGDHLDRAAVGPDPHAGEPGGVEGGGDLLLLPGEQADGGEGHPDEGDHGDRAADDGP